MPNAAEVGKVLDFLKQGSGSLLKQISDQFENPNTADPDRLRQLISKYWKTQAGAVPGQVAAAATTEAPAAIGYLPQDQHFDDGGSVDDSEEGQEASGPSPEIPGIPEGEMMAFQDMPPAMLQQMTLNRIADLYQPAMQMPAYGEGGVVEDVGNLIDKYLDQIANEHAARAVEAHATNPNTPRPPLHQPTEDPLYQAATQQPAAVKNPLSPGFLSKRQAFADGGASTDHEDNAHSALNWLKNKIENMNVSIPFDLSDPDIPTEGDPDQMIAHLSPKGEARIAVRAAQQLYGVDKNGNPVFLGGITTKGATPPGIVDEALSVPDTISGLIDMGGDLDKAIGLGKFALPKGDPFAFSKNAADRLTKLNAAVNKDTGIGAPEGLAEDAEDLAGQIGPLAGAARLAGEGTAARKALDELAGWSGAGGEAPAKKAAPQAAAASDDDSPVIDEAEPKPTMPSVLYSGYAGGGDVDLARRGLLKLLGALGVGAAAGKPALEELASKVSKAPVKGAAMSTPDKAELADRFQWLKDEFFGPSDEPNWELVHKVAATIPGTEKLRQSISDYDNWSAGLTHENAFTPENEAENMQRVNDIEDQMDALADAHGVPRAKNPNAE